MTNDLSMRGADPNILELLKDIQKLHIYKLGWVEK